MGGETIQSARSGTSAFTVLIVNFNAAAETGRALEAVESSAGGLDWDAVVVDNGPSDVRRFHSSSPRITVIHNEANIGFGAAVNQAARAAASPVLLLLNPDTLVRPGAVPALIEELERWPDCAAIGPGIVNPDGSNQGSARSDPTAFTGLFGRATLLTRVFPRLVWVRRNIRLPSDVPAGSRSIEVDWVSGACMAIRRDAFARIGGFDERYFLYWEDADLCRRLRAAGSCVRYFPGARVEHAIGVSSRSAQRLAIREFHRSAYLYYTTHAAPSRWHPGRFAAAGLLTLRCGYYLVRALRAPRPATAVPQSGVQPAPSAQQSGPAEVEPAVDGR